MIKSKKIIFFLSIIVMAASAILAWILYFLFRQNFIEPSRYIRAEEILWQYTTLASSSICLLIFLKVSLNNSLNRILGINSIAKLILAFVFSILSLHIIAKFINIFIEFDCPKYWPISVFSPASRGLFEWGVVLGISLVFLAFSKHFSNKNFKLNLSSLIIAAIILILGANAIQGLEGFTKPISGKSTGEFQYYHDAINVKDTKHFICNFNEIQPNLKAHSKVHPPGAVLIIYWFNKIFKENIFLVSISIALIAGVLSALFFYKFLRFSFDYKTSKYAVFLLTIIPGVQIYYCTTIDALVAACLLGVLYFLFYPNKVIGAFGAAVFCFLASFLTFGFIFILPVIFLFELLNNKSILKFSIISFCLIVFYGIFYILFDFNYLQSFINASIIENPNGFRLFVNPVNYILTRLEGITEIILFIGPCLLLLIVKCCSFLKKNYFKVWNLFYIALLTLLMMFTTGAFRTGETARICLFIYPYLILPIIALMLEKKCSVKEQVTLLSVVFVQSLFMQINGSYFW